MFVPRRTISFLYSGMLFAFLLFVFLPLAASEKDSYASAIALSSDERPNGDVNQDGKENIFDLLELLRVLSGKTTSPVSDVNKDSKTNIFDLLAILKILPGHYENPPKITAVFNDQIIGPGDSLAALEQASISISYRNRIDSTIIEVNGERTTDELNFTETGTYLVEVRAYGNAQVTELNFTCSILAAVTIKGQHFDNDTEQGDKAVITINGKEYYTDNQGKFNVRIPKEQEYIITARQLDENGNFEGFKRTKRIPGMDIDTLKVYSVDYPTQENVSPELFKQFCEEACFGMGANGFGYKGLKTGLKNPKNRFWISSHGDAATYSEGGLATAEEQAYVKNLLETEIYPHLRPEYRFPIHVEDPNSLEQIPAFQDGVISVIPFNDAGFYFGPSDNNQNGIMDNCLIYLCNGGWNEFWKRSIVEELASSLFGMNGVNNDNITYKTALSSAGYLTQIDDKLINIQHRYKPKEQIENILGL